MPEQSKSSTHKKINRVSTLDGNNDAYDHAINLVDATVPVDEPAEGLYQTETSITSDSQPLNRNSTRASVKGRLAQRKYAKWQQDRYDSKDGTLATAEEVREEGSGSIKQRHGRKQTHTEHGESAAVDFGHSPESPVETQKHHKKHARHHKHSSFSKEEFAIDILYENQRGSFFCGIPLYSHSSLLQFDPAPWVNRDYKASAVNITNAQVPDPSWQWSWKHWYVDMSEDVDEDGWQYSFAFFGKFAWHGTHPWFHSFCRRRRWLRKRTKTAMPGAGKPQSSSMSAAHRLNTDYFTIHSKRDRSPSPMDGAPRTARADSYMSYQTDATQDEPPEDINDVASLLKALRLAKVDREKVDVVKKFVENGGEELAYLGEQIPEIMHFLVFQNSKRQILEYLRQTAREAQLHREEHDAEDRPEGEAESRRIDNILKAVKAADEQIGGLEYWSDRKHIMITTEHTKSLTESPLVTIFDKNTEHPQPLPDDSPAGEIRGIATEKAGIGQVSIRETTYRGATLASGEDSGKGKDKGKGKMKEEANDSENDPEELERLPSHLQHDQMIIPDKDA